MRADLLLKNALVTWDGSGEPEQLQYGQLLPKEGKLLRQLAKHVPGDQSIVEVGSYTGKSMSCLAQGSADGHHAKVYAVDLWTSGTSKKGRGFRTLQSGEVQGSSKFHTQPVLDVFMRRMKRYGNGLVVPRTGASVEVAETFEDDTVGLLFIDAEHTYEACRADFEAWERKVSVDCAVIALHDYALKPGTTGGVKQYIDEMLARTATECSGGSRWRLADVVGSLAVLEERCG